MLKKIFFSAYLIFISAMFAQQSGDINLGKYFTINSEILKQERQIYISLPNNYEKLKRNFPVLYILDGQGSFIFASAVVKFLSGSGRIPEMIVVGIPNIDRTYDLTPAKLDFRKSGNGKKFLEFLIEEVRGFVEDNYNTDGYNILSGHSLGGNFTVYSMFSETEKFDAYIAISPYLASANNYTLELVKQKIKSVDLNQKYLFTAIGNEPGYVDFMDEFMSQLKSVQTDNFCYNYMQFPDENHLSVRMKGVYEGLKKLFDSWILKEDKFLQGIDAIEEHFAAFEEKTGFEYKPKEALINQVGYIFLRNNEISKALEIFLRNTQLYPGSANVYHSYGQALLRNRNYQDAKENYEKAVRIAEEVNHPNKEFFSKELREVEKLIIH